MALIARVGMYGGRSVHSFDSRGLLIREIDMCGIVYLLSRGIPAEIIGIIKVWFLYRRIRPYQGDVELRRSSLTCRTRETLGEFTAVR